MAPTEGQQAFDFLNDGILLENEKVVWTGRPAPMAAARKEGAKLVMGLLFLGFTIYWTLVESGGNQIFQLVGVVCGVVGLWIASRPVRTYFRAGRSYYAITDRRVLIITAGGGYDTTSLTIKDIDDVRRTDNSDGTGNIQLRQPGAHGKHGTRSTVEFTDGLWGIRDVKAAASAINALRKSAESA